jgi:hypothetical protein
VAFRRGALDSANRGVNGDMKNAIATQQHAYDQPRINLRFFFIAAASFLFFLPSLDTFSSGFNKGPNIIEYLLGIKTDRANVLYGKCVVLALGILVAINGNRVLANKRVRLTALATLVLVLYGHFVLWRVGEPFGLEVRTGAMVGIYIFGLTVAFTPALFANLNSAIAVGAGIGLAAGINVIYSTLSYFRFGGLEVVEGAQSLAMDGGVLTLWNFSALAAVVLFEYLAFNRRYSGSAIFLAALVVFGGALAASFRRTMTIGLLIEMGIGTVVLFWLRGRAVRGIVVSGLIFMIGSLALISLLIFQFGIENTTERIKSVSFNSDSSFSGSNEDYLDDWKSLGECLLGSNLTGTGLEANYGVPRMIDLLSEQEGNIPFHTGTFEMWASCGIVGILYHCVILIWLPVHCLLKCRPQKMGRHMLTSIAFAFFMFMAAWPFGPPFYVVYQSSVLMGLCLGYLLSVADA